MTTSAPRARHTETGTGLTSPPSTNQSSPFLTGLKISGRLIEARTASAIGPVLNHISRPLTRLVATAANGFFVCSIGAVIPSSLSSSTVSFAVD